VVALAVAVTVAVPVAVAMTDEFIVAFELGMLRFPGFHAVIFDGLSVKFAVEQLDTVERQVNVRLWKSPQVVSTPHLCRLPIIKGQRDSLCKKHVDCLLEVDMTDL